jgi:hypothetical protein
VRVARSVHRKGIVKKTATPRSPGAKRVAATPAALKKPKVTSKKK